VLACEGIGVTPYVPKPLTLGSKAKGRFGKQDFVYLADDDVYRCPAGKTLTRRFTSVEDGIDVSVARIPGEDYPAALGDYGPDPSGAERRVQCRIRDLWRPCSWPTG
jgi:hypothetical protein